MSDAQQLYRRIVSKQLAQDEGVVPEFDPADKEMYMRKARQGHVYGRTKNKFSEEGIEEDGRRTSTNSEWSDSSGVRPETAAIRRDDSNPEGESGAADVSATEAIGVATGGTDAPVGGATARGANSRQRKSARHSTKEVNGLGGAE